MRGPAIVLFVVQFILNLVWSPLFFAAHQVTSALYLAGAIAGLTLITLILLAMIRKVAALLMLPYLLWLCFAVYLTLEIDRLNHDARSAALRVGKSVSVRVAFGGRRLLTKKLI